MVGLPPLNKFSLTCFRATLPAMHVLFWCPQMPWVYSHLQRLVWVSKDKGVSRGAAHDLVLDIGLSVKERR